MAKKKRPGKKRASARGHQEGNVIRWREVTEKKLVRIGPDGKRIYKNLHPRSPINTFDKNWLSSYLLDSSVSGPPVFDKPPPPDNVVSFADAKKVEASKPVSVPGNEAEKVPDVVSEKQGWLHNKAIASEEFKNWSRISKEIGRNLNGSEPWTVDEKGKLSSPSLEEQRKRSIEGHNRLKFKKPPSLVHNPFLSEPAAGGYSTKSCPVCVHNARNRANKPLDKKFWDLSAKHEPKAPSGLPISEFITGKYKPWNEKVVVCPTSTTKLRWNNSGSAAEAEVVFTAEAANDSKDTEDVFAAKKKYWVDKTHGTVQWFINHVPPDSWPPYFSRFVTWKKDGPIVNSGAIREAANSSEMEAKLLRSMLQAHEDEWYSLNRKVEELSKENESLSRELKYERQASRTLEFQLAHAVGDKESAELIKKELEELYIGKPKSPPEDADAMLLHYRMYQSFERVYGPEHAFARFVYGDPSLGKVIREHADMRTAHRMKLYSEREALRRIASNVKERVVRAGYVKYPEIKKFREKAALYRIKNKVRYVDDSDYARWWKLACEGKVSTYYSRLKYKRLEKDVTLFRKWGNKVTPFNRKKPVDYQAVINKVVGVRSVEYSSPSLVEHYKELGFKHKKYINKSDAKFWLKQTWKGKLVKNINKVIKILNTEVNPLERAKAAKAAKAKAEAKAKAKAEAKRLKKEAAQRIKDAELKLHSRGFIIVDR